MFILYGVYENCVSDRLVTYIHYGFTFRPILLLELSVFPLICRYWHFNLVFPMSYLLTPQTMNFVYNVSVTYISYRMRGDSTMVCAGIFATLIDFYGEHLGQFSWFPELKFWICLSLTRLRNQKLRIFIIDILQDNHRL